MVPESIRLAWKWSAGTNTLAYYDMTTITDLRKFTVQAPSLLVKIPACYNQLENGFGFLWRCDTNRIGSTCVASIKVCQECSVLCSQSWVDFAENLPNLSTFLVKIPWPFCQITMTFLIINFENVICLNAFDFGVVIFLLKNKSNTHWFNTDFAFAFFICYWESRRVFLNSQN